MRLIAALTAVCFLAACAGRTPNPVLITQYSDREKSCKELGLEMDDIQAEIQRLLPQKDKTAKNVALGVAGWFLIVPLFFMDFKNAEAQEYEAYRQRYNHLSRIAQIRNCRLNTIDLPSVQEMKQKYEKKQRKEREERGAWE